MSQQHLPSPEELFDKSSIPPKETVRVERRRIPEYRVVNTFSLGFVIVLILVIALIMNMDRLGIHLYQMMSGSMGDMVPEGSLVVCREVDAATLKVGDVITYQLEDGPVVTHQIVSAIESENGPMFITKGVNNSKVDSIIVKGLNVQGKMMFYIPKIGELFGNTIQQHGL